MPTLGSIISDNSPSILKICVPILLQISWIFQNIPNFLHLDGFEESYGQIIKKIRNQKNVNLSKSWNLTFFQDKISDFFFIPVVQEYLNEISPTLHGPNKLKTSGKPLRIADLQPPASGQDKPDTLYILYLWEYYMTGCTHDQRLRTMMLRRSNKILFFNILSA